MDSPAGTRQALALMRLVVELDLTVILMGGVWLRTI